MNNDSKYTPLWSFALTILIVAALVKAGWSLIDSLFLPHYDTITSQRNTLRPLPHNFRVVSNEALPKPITRKRPKIHASIRDLKLLAVYLGEGQNLAVIQKGSRSLVAQKGEKVFGYLLREFYDRSILLERNGKEYRLEIQTPKVESHATLIPLSSRAIPPKASENFPEVRKEGESVIVPKSLLSEYTKNIDKIWTNIGIEPIEKDGKLKGFMVRYIKRRSVFAKLGLKRGDLIVGINGEPVEDFGIVQDLLQEIEELDNLTLTIKRGQKEMELDYEIR